MTVMVPREKWTDERLDDLNKKVDAGFARLDKRIDRLDEDIKDLRREINARFDHMNDSISARFDALQRNQTAGLFVVVAAVIGSNVL
jgi:chaperonin cofactor prefoldin